ncbi:hypothetical protein [Cryobacterium sp. Hz9]|uniref:hypothetical protein n=1 Tax=Cryobacterium sp. Hz9 TaxID=1259167 RepID=UPI00106BE321|nr:hypothetical protein [Cryobacterium sp. Hz9]TFB66785.1 hypothetical protein E3N85_09350 [Cryobacterium sp. Hz9]
MSNNQHEPCAAADLELCILSDHEWRVADRRQDEQSPEKVLGYINQSGSLFEVLNIEAPRRHLTFNQFHSAVESFTATSNR